MPSTADTWTSFISHHEPTLLMTITFRKVGRTWSAEKAISTLNRLLHFVNTSLFRKRYQRGEDYLQGFAALEHQHNDQPHVHIMLVNPLPPETIHDAIRRHIDKFTVQVDTSQPRQRQRLRSAHQRGIPRWAIKDAARQHIRPVPIFSAQGIDVRQINQTPDDFERLTDYLLKETDEFLLLDQDGLTYPDKHGALPSFPVISRPARTILPNFHDA